MAKSNFIGEEEASKLLGLKPSTIKIYISKGVLPIRRSKATYRSKSAFHLGDIETFLSQKLITYKSSSKNEGQQLVRRTISPDK